MVSTLPKSIAHLEFDWSRPLHLDTDMGLCLRFCSAAPRGFWDIFEREKERLYAAGIGVYKCPDFGWFVTFTVVAPAEKEQQRKRNRQNKSVAAPVEIEDHSAGDICYITDIAFDE